MMAKINPLLRCAHRLVIVGLVAFGLHAHAQQQQAYVATPPTLAQAYSDLMFMLALSSDHQLYFEAYNDFDDLTPGDGVDAPTTTYSPHLRYEGYFDNQRCYLYQSEVFTPTATVPVGDASTGVTNAQYCGTTEWSGNFLNWATMTRIDLVRHALYGGYRSTDTVTQTILERSYLPNDAHSFAKYYNGADLQKLTPYANPQPSACGATDAACRLSSGITFCNTTKHPKIHEFLSQALNTATNPPLMRAVEGNYSLWASGERYQCLVGPDFETPDTPPDFAGVNVEVFDIGNERAGQNGNIPSETGMYAHGFAPTGILKDFVVRVEVCSANARTNNNCKQYGASYKPTGVLQEYGSNGKVKFGLMTGGYNTTKSFGVLRKNVGDISGEFSVTDGTFLKPVNSLIGSLDALRIVDYQYYNSGDQQYSGTYNSNCEWGMHEFNNGQCRNWGNPFAEILTETYRYYSGATASLVTADDSALLGGLGVEAWASPTSNITKSGACPSMNVLGLDASYSSFDSDFINVTQGMNTLSGGALTPQLLGIGSGTETLTSLTDDVGTAQGLGTGDYFAGNSGADKGNVCIPKTIANLSTAYGVCPEAPGLQGSYLGAGLASYVYANDILTSVPDVVNTVETWGVQLAGTQPNIKVKHTSGSEVTILPACLNKTVRDRSLVMGVPTGSANCAIVDFKPVSVTTTAGSYFVSWEDSEQGGDYDTDVTGMINYEVVGTTLNVYTRAGYNSTDDPMGFGFVISGTDNDGYYLPTAVDDTASDPGAAVFESDHDCADKANCSDVTAGAYNGWQKTTFGITAFASAEFLPTPLELAAKHGSSDPSAFARITKPGALKSALEAPLSSVSNRARTATSASVNATSIEGEGLFLHTLYQPTLENQTQSINWVSSLAGLFIDAQGRVREDTTQDQTLTAADKIIHFKQLPGPDGGTGFDRYSVDAIVNGVPNPDHASYEGNVPIEGLSPLWDARSELADLSTLQVINQRAYGTTASSGRHILTAVDKPNSGVYDGQIVSDEVTPFTLTGLNAANSSLLPLLDSTDAQHGENILRYIRGEDITGMRSRTFDWGNGDKVWRLGDIIHSTAAIVGRPASFYDIAFSDATYSAYRYAQRNRRQMVYVGANDGLLHAFNAGFFDGNTNTYRTALTGSNVTTHPLGAELWAYAPHNLLPHLKWLTQTDYANNHVYFVDSEVQTFDVNIFTPDNTTYIGGWGTIIVVGMRFGGGDYELDPDGAGPRPNTTLRSAYMIFDVTDPEAEPKLLGEISHEDLGHTMGKVAIMKQRTPSATDGTFTSPSENKWSLVFGSGPQGGDGIREGISDRPAKLFTLDLNDLQSGTVDLQAQLVDAAGAQSYVGAVTVTDWDSDFTDDMVYFGLVGDGVTKRGELKQAKINTNNGVLALGNASRLLTGVGTDLPFSNPPVTARDQEGTYWLFTGSGRFLTQADLSSQEQNAYFGIKVNDAKNDGGWLESSGINISSLKNVADVKVYKSALGGTYVADPANPTDNGIDQYLSNVAANSGWYRPLNSVSQTQFTRSALSGTTLVYNAFDPIGGTTALSCKSGGKSSIYILDMFTGLGQYRLENAFTSSNDTVTSDNEVYELVDPVGAEIDDVLSDPVVNESGVIFKGADGSMAGEEIKEGGTGPQRRAWREISIEELR